MATQAVAEPLIAPDDDGMADRKNDRHKPSRMMRIAERLAEVLDELAERNATTAPAEANRLIREGLEKLGMWPPPPEPPASPTRKPRERKDRGE